MFRIAISCKSSLQSVVALSTTKGEYIAIIATIKEALWLQGIARELGIQQGTVVVFYDN